MTKVIQGVFRGTPLPAKRAAGSFPLPAGALSLAGAPGRPLPVAILRKMEAAFGADFRDVRIHEGPEAAALGAVAFAAGSNLYFERGRFRPETAEGRKLLGQALAHVLQQRAGRVRNPFGKGVAVVRESRLDAEAERLAQRAAMPPPPPHFGAASVQRRPMPAPPRLPGRVVQRMEIVRTKVNMSSLYMSQEYRTLMEIWFSYSRDDGRNYGTQVSRDFMVATYLGIAPYTTDNHASGNPGGPGDGQKAREEHDHYDAWRLVNGDAIDAVQIEYGGGGKRGTGSHIPEQVKLEQKQKKDTKKATSERSKHAQWHVNQGQPRPLIGVNDEACPVCGLEFKT